MIRVLITSRDHPDYNQTATIVRDLKDKGVEVRLDHSSHLVLVPEKQWKVISLQEDHKKDKEEKDRDSDIMAYVAVEGALSILGDIFSF